MGAVSRRRGGGTYREAARTCEGQLGDETNTVASDPLNHVLGGYSRFRRYTPRMLRTLDIEASPVAKPLLEAVDVLRSDATAGPTVFLRPNSTGSRWTKVCAGWPPRREPV